MTARTTPLFAFSTFIFDPESGELTQNGVRVRVNKQIADLLTLLILNAGQLVTRAQIREALWPEQEFLNHEKIITNAVSRLRLIFRDDPANPQYIESIPKRGYRLVVKVEPILSPVANFPLADLDEESSAGHEIQLEERFPVVLPPLSEIPLVAPTRPGWGRLHILIAVLLVIVLAIPAALWFVIRYRPAAPASVSLGIAPFETSGDGAKELAESFRLDLTDALAQLPQLNVRAAHSLERFSLNETTFRDNATKLGLDAILFGTFTLDGNQCHLRFELVRGRDLAHLASFQYNASRSELTTIRDKIQMETFARLDLPGTGRQRRPDGAAQGNTSDPEAYDAYLRASYHLSLQTPDSMRLALKEYGDAIARDPHFAKAYARQARTYIFLGESNLIQREESFRQATAAATKALELDGSSPEGHAVLGLTHFLHDWNLPAGEKEINQAILLDPNQPLYHQWLALIFCDEGRFRKSLQEIDVAHANDPFWVSAYISEAYIASNARDTPRVLATVRKLMELMPDSPHARDAIGNAQWSSGHYMEAIAAWRAMAALENDPQRMAMEDRGLEAFHRGGAPAYAQVRLDAIRSGQGTDRHPNDFDPAEWYAIAGESESALQALREEVSKRSNPQILGLAVMPAFDGLHQNPEFQTLLTRMGITLPPKNHSHS